MTNKLCQWFGHKFRPRYSTGPALEVSEAYWAKILETPQPKTYHYDICERCGTVVNKPPGK